MLLLLLLLPLAFSFWSATLVVGVTCLLAIIVTVLSVTRRRDLAGRQRVKEALLDSERRYQLLFEANPRAMWVYDCETLRFLAVNEAAVRHYGYSREEFLGMTIKDIRPPEDVAKLLENLTVIPSSLSHPTAWSHRRKDETLIDVQITSHEIVFGERRARLVLAEDVTGRRQSEEALREAKGELERRVLERTAELSRANDALVEEITERQRTEGALRESEEGYRAFVSHSSEAIWRVEFEQPLSVNLSEEEQIERFYHHAYLTECNDVMARMYGLAQSEEMIGVRFSNLLPRDKPENLAYLTKFVQSQYRSVDAESHEVDLEGSPKRFLNNMIGIVEAGRLLRVWGTQRDITERKRAEEALEQSREWLGAIFEASRDGIVVEEDEHIVYANKAFVDLYGYDHPEELIGSHTSRFQSQEDNKRMVEFGEKRLLGEPAPSAYEFEGVRRDGATIDLEASVSSFTVAGKFYIITVIRNIVERKHLEEQLRQSQKMEAVGSLAGGVAHDFNNLLTAITGYSELMLRRLKEGDPLLRNVEQIRKAADRAASLTRQLLAFSRKQVLQAKVLDLNAIVADMDKMLVRLIGEDVDLVTALNPTLGRIKADPGQIEQVVMNLAVNARDAMPQGGKLTVETDNIYLDQTYTQRHAAVTPGHYVMLAVSDTGCGMSAEVQSRIFEPFFTTKGVGKGTGLGLSTVYGIVKQSGGHLWVYTEVAHGTTFKIYLPLVEDELDAVGTKTDQAEQSAGTETVLLVEDEEIVRAMAREVLQLSGYNVLEAAHGEEALRVCAQYEGKIDLLLTDVVMPQMSGRELAERLALLRSEMSVLYMSGYTDNAIVRHGVLESKTAFLQKPFTPDAMARKIREVLDATRRN